MLQLVARLRTDSEKRRGVFYVVPAWGYNRAILFLGDKIRAPGPRGLGSLGSETMKCRHESRGTWT
jgi:hypothetical protein